MGFDGSQWDSTGYMMVYPVNKGISMGFYSDEWGFHLEKGDINRNYLLVNYFFFVIR
jgi:hypothetical protein